jgi:hypothetical protein
VPRLSNSIGAPRLPPSGPGLGPPARAARERVDAARSSPQQDSPDGGQDERGDLKHIPVTRWIGDDLLKELTRRPVAAGCAINGVARKLVPQAVLLKLRLAQRPGPLSRARKSMLTAWASDMIGQS